ncbi:MAG: hypothetical protein PHV11_10110 [Candidatus Bipolaricaulis sp.]|nr:hypothetical protein [Candidatus Bipolaricaulis sp.]
MKDTTFSGNIVDIRAIEDCIRATRKYTEGIGTMRFKHPVQGEDSHSRVFCKYYEVCPDTEVHWDMPAGTALEWVTGKVKLVDIRFYYDYRANKASVIVCDGDKNIDELSAKIPRFKELLAAVSGSNGNLPNSRRVAGG